MVVCRGFGLYFHKQEVLAGVFSLFAGILEKLFFLVLCPLVGPLCIGSCYFGNVTVNVHSQWKVPMIIKKTRFPDASGNRKTRYPDASGNREL